MNCSGEEQERLLSLLEQEEAKKKTASRLPKDERNGELPRSCSALYPGCVKCGCLADRHPSLHSKRCLHCSGMLPEN